MDPATPGLQAAALGDAEPLQQGDDVFAVGRSTSGRLLVSAGVVALEIRPDEAGSELTPFFIDARIAPETAGGPILDREGRVVGIGASSADTPPLPFGGLGPIGRSEPTAGPPGFARVVPVAVVRRAVETFGAGGLRSYIGVRLGPPRPEPFGLPGRQAGAWVEEVLADSPADKAGLRRGDRITQIDGRPIPDGHALSLAVEATPSGATLRLQVDRDGDQLEIPVVTAPIPSRSTPGEAAPTPPDPGDVPASRSDRGASPGPKIEVDADSELPKPLP